MKNIINISSNAPINIQKSVANKQLKKMHEELFSLQNLFYAEGKHALLIVLQGMDTAGKDGTIRHVFSCVNPQGCLVRSFKTPTEEEKSHDFLWRIYANLPEKGMFQIFNRSHYEDILFPVVHQLIDTKEIERRHQAINEFEAHLKDSGTIVLKFFLHISRKEQNKRINIRLKDPEKRWKYNPADKKEAKLWDEYLDAYQAMIDKCSKNSPWLIVPSDHKWYRNYLIAKTMVKTLENLKMKYPK